MGVQTRDKKLDRRTAAFIEAIAAAGHTSPDTAATTEQIAAIRGNTTYGVRRSLLSAASRGLVCHMRAQPYHKWYVEANVMSSLTTRPPSKEGRSRKINYRTIEFLLKLVELGHTSAEKAVDADQIAVIQGRSRTDICAAMRNFVKRGLVTLTSRPGKLREKKAWYVQEAQRIIDASAPGKEMPRDIKRRCYTKKTPGCRFGVPWTAEENKYILSNWGEEELANMSWRLKRTPVAIARQAYHLGLSARHGLKQKYVIARETGYPVRRIEIAIERLGLKGKTIPRLTADRIDPKDPRNQIGYDHDEVDQIISLLSSHPDAVPLRSRRSAYQDKGEWGVGKRPSSCARCGLTTKPHYARGMDKRCYDIWIESGKPYIEYMTLKKSERVEDGVITRAEAAE